MRWNNNGQQRKKMKKIFVMQCVRYPYWNTPTSQMAARLIKNYLYIDSRKREKEEKMKNDFESLHIQIWIKFGPSRYKKVAI